MIYFILKKYFKFLIDEFNYKVTDKTRFGKISINYTNGETSINLSLTTEDDILIYIYDAAYLGSIFDGIKYVDEFKTEGSCSKKARMAADWLKKQLQNGVKRFEIENGSQLHEGKYLLKENFICHQILGDQKIYFCDNRNAYLNFDSKTKQCFGISMNLRAFKFNKIKYSLPNCKTARLLYDDISSKDISFFNNFKLKFYVDEAANLILIGNVHSLNAPIRFFSETFGAINDGKLELLIICVDNEIIKSINKLN